MKNKMVKSLSVCGISWKLYEKNCHAYQWPILNLGENDNNTLWASYRAGAVEAIKVWVCRSLCKSKFFQIKLAFNKGRCQKVGVQLHTLHTPHRPCDVYRKMKIILEFPDNMEMKLKNITPISQIYPPEGDV